MKYRGNQPMMRTFAARALSFSAIAAFALTPALNPVVAADYRGAAPLAQAAPVVEGQMNARPLALGIGKSIVIDLPRDIKDVLVADPKIANAVVRSAQRAYIIGAAVGQTNIVFFDSAGQQIVAYDIAVTRDLNGVRAALKQAMPNADIRIEGLGEGVMLSGSVATPIEAQQANDLAARLVGGPDKIVNSIVVRGKDQVMLKVTVAEVSRSIIKQLGIDLSATLNSGTSTVTFNNSNPFTANGLPIVAGNQLQTSFGPSVKATLRAMESAGVVRTLAEPNLTAISGESATFIAGGEFPIPTGVTCQTTAAGSVGQCAPSIAFKKFGISLNFTPVVLTEGRISLHVMTEVSEVSNDNSINISGISVPSIKTRRNSADVDRIVVGHFGDFRHHMQADDGSLRSVQRQFDQHQRNFGAVDQDPPRRNHAGDSFRRRDGDGRLDPAAAKAGDQRTARPVDPAGAGDVVPQPRLRQQPDRTDGARDALHRARRRSEGSVATGRRLCRGFRSASRSPWQHQSH